MNGTFNTSEAFSKLSNLLSVFKKAEDVTTIPSPEAQKTVGTEQTKVLEENTPTNISPDTTNTEPAPVTTDQVPSGGTDTKTDTEGAAMKVNTAEENAKEASLGAAFARGLVAKAAAMKQTQESAPYITGKEMFQKKAAMLSAKTAEEAEAAAKDFYANIPALQNNPYYKDIFNKCAQRKLAEDVATAMEFANAPQGSEEEIAQALQQAIANDPEAQAELEGEITGESIDQLNEAEQQTEAVQQIADAVGVAPEAVMQAAQLIEAAAAEQGVPVEEFINAVDQSLQQPAAAPQEPVKEEAPKSEVPPAAPVEGEQDASKQASMRRVLKAATYSLAKK